MCGGLVRFMRTTEELPSNTLVPPTRVIRIDGEIHVVYAQHGRCFRIEGDIPDYYWVNGDLVLQGAARDVEI